MTALRPRRLMSATFGRFMVVGGVSYLVNQAMLVLLYEGPLGRLPRGNIDLGLLAASLIAVEVSILVRFVLNDRWTFRLRCRRPLVERLYQSNVSSFASPLISLACVNILTPQLGVSYLLANSLGIAAGLAWNWLWSDRVVWRRPVAGAA